MRPVKWLIAAMMPALIVQASAGELQHISILTCPIYRDAGARDCWLAEHEGKRYYIGRFGVGQPPELLHQALIQGQVTDQISCGAQVIQPLAISVLPDIDYRCDTILPDNGDRPSEPGIFDDPRILGGAGLAPPTPTGPFVAKQFAIRFGHDRAFIDQEMQREVETAFIYAAAGPSASVEVVGRLSDARLDNGDVLKENAVVARERAERVAAALVALGLPASRVTAKWNASPAVADGIHDPQQRIAEINVTFTPGGSGPR